MISTEELRGAADQSPRALQRGYRAIQQRDFNQVFGNEETPPIDLAATVEGHVISEYPDKALAELLFTPEGQSTLLRWKDRLGFSITCRATALGNTHLISSLLKEKTFQTKSEPDQITPLALSAQFGHIEIFSEIAKNDRLGKTQLVTYGRFNRSAAHYGAFGGHTQILEAAKQCALSFDHRDVLGCRIKSARKN